MDLLQLAGFSAAGGIGGMIYWLFAEREQLITRARALLARER
jgi:hypothetical protein